MQAYIYRNYKKVHATRQLQINRLNVAFFTAPVMETSEFLSSEDGKEWLLKFFIGSAFEQTLVVKFCSDPAANEYLVGRASWWDNANDVANDGALLSSASKFLRNSETLTFAKSAELSANRTLLADRDGFAYFSSDSEQFRRIVLCQALAIAYVQVITACMASTTKCVLNNRTEEALELYENILRFNAAHYFTLPVQVERHELFAAWSVLCQHYHLKVLNQELTQQLSDIAALLNAEREKQRAADEAHRISTENAQRQALKAHQAREGAREAKAERRRTFLISITGLFLTAMSLLSLFQLTPAQFSANVGQWKNLIWKTEAEKTVEPPTKPNGTRKGKH